MKTWKSLAFILCFDYAEQSKSGYVVKTELCVPSERTTQRFHSWRPLLQEIYIGTYFIPLALLHLSKSFCWQMSFKTFASIFYEAVSRKRQWFDWQATNPSSVSLLFHRCHFSDFLAKSGDLLCQLATNPQTFLIWRATFYHVPSCF